MKRKLLNVFLILTSLLGYLEWGGGNSMFLFQGEFEVLGKLYHDPVSAAHPFTLLPLFGQILLVFTLFQRTPGKIITLIGLGCISILLLFIVLVGAVSLNLKILFSTIPFIITGIFTIKEIRKK